MVQPPDSAHRCADSRGYLSIDDPLEEVYRYPEGYQIIQELAVEPLQLDHADLADRMIQGGALSFSSIWNHINKYLPDEAYTLINARLSRIKRLNKKAERHPICQTSIRICLCWKVGCVFLYGSASTLMAFLVLVLYNKGLQ